MLNLYIQYIPDNTPLTKKIVTQTLYNFNTVLVDRITKKNIIYIT